MRDQFMDRIWVLIDFKSSFLVRVVVVDWMVRICVSC